MKKTLHLMILVITLFIVMIHTVQAASISVTGQIFYTTAINSEGNLEEGTTFDRWNIKMLDSGRFSVDVLAFESTSNSVDDAVDINGDGEFTYLDPDTYFYKDTGNPLVEADFLARCDDINNNCDTIDTPTIKLSSWTQEQGALDGSIHFRRDPAFDVQLAAGEYLYLMADYRLSPKDAEEGFDFGNSIRNTALDGYADYQITFSSNSMNFEVSGNTITISSAPVAAIPLPAGIWLLCIGLISLIFTRKSN